MKAFDPHSEVIQTCLEGLRAQEEGRVEEARGLFMKAWNASVHGFERFHSAHFLARTQSGASERLSWLELALKIADVSEDAALQGARPSLHAALAKAYEDAGDLESAKKSLLKSERRGSGPSDQGPFYHGTRADLRVGDFLNAGGSSNYKDQLKMNHIYFTALADGAGLAAALAKGELAERVYIVEPTGRFEDDPNVTDKKFLGNPTRSYRSEAPLKIIGELREWTRLSGAQLAAWRAKLAGSKGEIIN